MSEEANWMEGLDSTNKARSTTIVNFYDEEVLHEKKSKEAGRPIYIKKTFIHKITPGDRLLDVKRPVREEDKEEWPSAWSRYEQKKPENIEGTPLTEWAYLSKTRVAELHALNVLTVEHIANLSDSAAHKIMDFHDLKRRARNYLSQAKDSAIVNKLNAALEEKTNVLEAQAKLIDDLNQRLKALEAPTERPPAVKKRGRPKGSKNRGANTS